jgi:hypothetical protein
MLWVGSQPNFQYTVSSNTSYYMYATLSVASIGFEVSDDFYQECAAFKDEVVPINMPGLMCAAKISGIPLREVKAI